MLHTSRWFPLYIVVPLKTVVVSVRATIIYIVNPAVCCHTIVVAEPGHDTSVLVDFESGLLNTCVIRGVLSG